MSSTSATTAALTSAVDLETDQEDYIVRGERIQGAKSKEGTCEAMCPDDEIAIRMEMKPHKLEQRYVNMVAPLLPSHLRPKAQIINSRHRGMDHLSTS